MGQSTGKLSSGARASVPTLDQVAGLAGVSRATASRAVNGESGVSPAAREAVERAVTALGYRPNRAARSLATRRSGSIALVAPEPDDRILSDPFFGGTVGGVSSALESTDQQLILLVSRRGASHRKSIDYLRSGHVDGAVIVSHHKDDNGLAESLVASGLPSVFVGRPWSDTIRLPYVDVDNVAGARMATEHLIARGRRRIGVVAGPADMSAGVDRLLGWRQAMAAAGRDQDAVAEGDFTSPGGHDATSALLRRFPELDAVFVASDLMAAGALRAVAAAGRSVPGDVAVVGFDNTESIATSTSPNLTSVDNPVFDMGRRAAQLLIGWLRTGEVPDSDVFRTRVVVRESS